MERWRGVGEERRGGKGDENMWRGRRCERNRRRLEDEGKRN